MKFAQFLVRVASVRQNRAILSVALSCLLVDSLISPGSTQPNPNRSNCQPIDREESTKIKSTNRRVSRQQQQLIIKTPQRSVVFRDSCNSPDESIVYTLKSYYSDLDYFLVFKSAYEEGEYILVNGKTGAKTSLWAEPIFSPDRRRFASMTIDELNGNTSVYLYRIDAMGVKIEYRDTNKWKPTNPVWRNNNSIEFVHNPHNARAKRVVLTKKNREWIVSG